MKKNTLQTQIHEDFLPHQRQEMSRQVEKLIGKEPTAEDLKRVKISTELLPKGQNTFFAALHFDKKIVGRFRNTFPKVNGKIVFGCEYLSKEEIKEMNLN